MSFKPTKKTSWRSLAYSLAALATLVLAAGARYKPG
jgi:anti-sigma-K factor RskA